MRTAYELPPWLAPDNTPSVSATSGLGTNGGAFVQTPDSGGFGRIEIRTGTNPAAGGYVNIFYGATPPTLFVAPSSDAFGTLSQNIAGNVNTISWTGTLPPNARLFIHYEWLDGNKPN